jgi:drug/metabolite transporter (DMT)-like permease
MFTSWIFWTVAFIILQVAFLQIFKLLTKKTDDIGSLTVCVQLLSSIFALSLFWAFGWQFPVDWAIWGLLGAALIFYAAADRLNAAARKNMDIGTESMLHQVWKLLFLFCGIIFLGRHFAWLKLLGGVIIVLANIAIFYEKGKFRFNKYVAVKFVAIVCFTAAMTLDVYNSDYFNLPFYCFLSFFVPAVFLLIARQTTPQKLLNELKNSNFILLLLCAFCNGIGAVTILRAYQLDYIMSASVSSVYVLINVVVAFIFLKERTQPVKKAVAALVILGGLLLTVLGTV